MKPEDILIRWMNFHLKKADQPEITNLGAELKDSKKLLYVLNQLDPANCSLDALSEADDEARATKMLACATAMGVEDCIGARDLLKGNAKVNSVFVAAVFNCKHGLQELTQEEIEQAGIIDDDIEGTREERAFRLWINSMQIENCFVEDLFEECRDGLVFIRVCHRIDPASVDMKKPNWTPKNPFHMNGNCEIAEEAMKFLGVKMIGVGAQDIAQGHKKNILAIIWQVMRFHYLKIIGSKTESDLLAWVNETVQPETAIKSFNDPQFADGKLLIKLAGSIEPRMVNQDLITPGVTDEEKEMNAKYAISIARKLGAIIFMVWDDIPRLNKKMLLIFVCSIYDIKHQIE